MNRLFLIVCFVILPLTVGFSGGSMPMGFELAESKEELKLDYDVSIVDHDTGRVTLVFTPKDDGRLKPVSNVDLYIPSDKKHVGGGVMSDLSLSLDLREVEGQRIARVHIAKELAENAQLKIKTNHLDGKREPRTWYYHKISFKDFAAKKQGEADSEPNVDSKADWGGQWQTNWGPMNLQSMKEGQLEGSYGAMKHSVNGTVDPDHPKIFSGTWNHSDSESTGRFRFLMTSENRFEGSWTYGDQDPRDQQTNWTGTRIEQ